MIQAKLIGKTLKTLLIFEMGLLLISCSQKQIKTQEIAQDQAVQEAVSKFGENSVETARALENSAELAQAQGETEKAKKNYTRAALIKENLKKGQDASQFENYLKLAELQSDSEGKSTQTHSFLSKAVGLLGTAVAFTNPLAATAIKNLANSHAARGEHQTSEDLYKNAISKMKLSHGETHPTVLGLMEGLAHSHELQGEHLEANEVQNKILEIKTKKFGNEHPQVISLQHDLATKAYSQGDMQKSQELMAKSFDSAQKTYGNDHPMTKNSMKMLSKIYIENGKLDKAEELVNTSLKTREEKFNNDGKEILELRQTLSTVQKMQGNTTAAQESEKIAEKLTEVVSQPAPMPTYKNSPLESIKTKTITVRSPSNTNERAKIFTVQIASLDSQSEATSISTKLKSKNIENEIQKASVDNKTWFRVRSGTFIDRKNAQMHKEKIEKTSQYRGIVISVERQ